MDSYHHYWQGPVHYQLPCTPLNDEDDLNSGICVSYALGNPALPLMQRFWNEPERMLSVPYVPGMETSAMHTLPEVPYYAMHVSPGSPDEWLHGSRFTSPTNSTIESSDASSECSGRQRSPLSSPHLSTMLYSPSQDFNDVVPHAYGGHPPLERHDSHSSGTCVALHDVQKCADDLPETFNFNTEPMPYSAYGSYAQEGYQPIPSGDESTSRESYSTPGTDYRNDEDETPQPQPELPVIRRRRPQTTRFASGKGGHVSSGRVSKRSGAGQRHSNRCNGEDNTETYAGADRAFPCPLAVYGCPSTFASKNEWKRHVSTQHMRLGYWRCDQCACNNGERKPNDFNRKDLFVQHVRRMHPEHPSNAPGNKKSKPKRDSNDDQLLQEAATRCYRPLRSAPEKSRCLYCEHHFQSWEERMEHIGRHMENAKKDGETATDSQNWYHDEDAEKWFIKQQVIVLEGKELVLST